jgi:hypothetical protein
VSSSQEARVWNRRLDRKGLSPKPEPLGREKAKWREESHPWSSGTGGDKKEEREMGFCRQIKSEYSHTYHQNKKKNP